MTLQDPTALALGFVLGLRHATDTDHIVVVGSLLQRAPGHGPAVRLAALWGAGHAASFLAVGLLVALAGVRVPPEAERGAELLVAAMLVGLGLIHGTDALRGRGLVGAGPDRGLQPARPLLIGVVHGLAGSAGIALVVSTTIQALPDRALYLVLFGAGSVLGMVAFTALLSRPLAWALRRGHSAHRAVLAVGAVLSLALGVMLFLER
jgi:hypothetical protein